MPLQLIATRDPFPQVKIEMSFPRRTSTSSNLVFRDAIRLADSSNMVGCFPCLAAEMIDQSDFHFANNKRQQEGKSILRLTNLDQTRHSGNHW